MQNFEKEFHNVDLGNGYLNDKSCAEIVKYISLSNGMKNFTKLLNSNTLNYYSVLFDGGSSAKCVDEKELFLIKTCEDGLPQFNVMPLEEPKECDAPGIKAAIENCIQNGVYVSTEK